MPILAFLFRLDFPTRPLQRSALGELGKGGHWKDLRAVSARKASANYYVHISGHEAEVDQTSEIWQPKPRSCFRLVVRGRTCGSLQAR